MTRTGARGYLPMTVPSSVFHLGDVRPFDASRVVIEDNAPMNPPRSPPRRVSKYRPLLDRMQPGQSCVLERNEGLCFMRWLRVNKIRASQSKVGNSHIRIKLAIDGAVNKEYSSHIDNATE